MPFERIAGPRLRCGWVAAGRGVAGHGHGHGNRAMKFNERSRLSECSQQQKSARLGTCDHHEHWGGAFGCDGHMN